MMASSFSESFIVLTSFLHSSVLTKFNLLVIEECHCIAKDVVHNMYHQCKQQPDAESSVKCYTNLIKLGFIPLFTVLNLINS